jgi:hypothetical protein
MVGRQNLHIYLLWAVVLLMLRTTGLVDKMADSFPNGLKFKSWSWNFFFKVIKMKQRIL